uniref:Uncharacterized protein n=1 Tax=Globodera rostochiensis TaxID=31243 RepID=A0A914HVN3_GLORO
MFDCPRTEVSAKIEKCPCRGLRYCALCLGTERVSKRRGDVRIKGNTFLRHSSMVYNVVDGKAHRCATLNSAELTSAALSIEEIARVRLVPNFISESEEQFLLSSIDCAQWAPSQSGRQKQDYGPRINFKAQRVNTTKFVGLPDYVDHLLRWISEREGTMGLLDGFSPVELCNLEYSSERLSSIDLHKDDAWIWGERLVSISLNSDCVFMLEHPDLKVLVFIPVPRRSLLCLFDRERFVWNHGIFPHHIYGRRVAITLRELAKAFLDEQHLGDDIMKRAAMRIETKTEQNFVTI